MNRSVFSFPGHIPSGPKVTVNDLVPLWSCHEPSDQGLPSATESFSRLQRDSMAVEAGWMRDWLVISEEINLFPLMEKVLRIVMLRTDAVKGCFFLETYGKLWVGAEAKRAPEGVSIVTSNCKTAKTQPQLSCVLNHVCKTRTPVLLKKPLEGRFLGLDPDILEALPPSVLCWPFPHGPTLVGVLYLEKDQPHRPFGQTAMQYLARLSPLISVSLKNAMRLKATENRMCDLEKASEDLKEKLAGQIRAVQSLRESEDRYRAIVHTIADGYYEVDLRGNFVFYNGALCEMLGYSREEMAGMNNRSFMTEETARKVYETFNKVYQTGQSSKAFDWELIRKDGQKRWVETSVSLVTGAEGQPGGFRGIARDVTAFKSLDKARERVIHHLSHELRTPVSVIAGALKIVSQNVGNADPKVRASLERALRNLRRLQQVQEVVDDIINGRKEITISDQGRIFGVIDDALALVEELRESAMPQEAAALLDNVMERLRSVTRPEKAKPESIEIAPFLEELCLQAKMRIGKRDIDLAIHFEEDIVLKMDRKVLGKVCSGLLRNAIENTPDEGRIEVEVKNREGFIELGLTDYGIGITPENQKFIFGGFFHTQETDRYSSGKPYQFNAGGSGSDLLRVKVFAERFGFEVSFTSQRCRFIPDDGDCCPGKISQCRFVKTREDCLGSGKSHFCVRFDARRFAASKGGTYVTGT